MVAWIQRTSVLHDILRLSAVAKERQDIGAESVLMTVQKLSEFERWLWSFSGHVFS